MWQMVTEALLEMGETGPLVDILQNQHPLFHEKVLVSLQNSEHPRAEAVLQAGDEPADGER